MKDLLNVHLDFDDYFNINLRSMKVQNIQSHLHIHYFLKSNFVFFFLLIILTELKLK